MALRSQGLTLNEIVHVVGRSKSSVYFHMKKVALSPEKAGEIAQRNIFRIIELNHSRKGKSARSFKTFNQWDERKIMLVSHFLFDGELTHSACVYNNRSRALIERVRNYMRDVYNYEPREIICDGGVIRISYFNIEIKITSRENIARFAREINFSPGVRVNGQRSNSIWKQSLEKKEILRRALVSYQAV